MELTWEGGFVLGGRYGRAFFLVVLVGVTLSPSGVGIALPVWWGWLVFGGFARIGRAVLNQEGGTVGGGLFCLGRVKWLRDLIKLLVGLY